jgi:hypothetical protein
MFDTFTKEKGDYVASMGYPAIYSANNNITFFFLYKHCPFNNLSTFSVCLSDSVLCRQDICIILYNRICIASCR